MGAALTLSACSGGGGSSPVTPPPAPIVLAHTFPAGDAVAAGGGTAWDIVGVTTTLSSQFHGGNGNLYDTLRVDVTFAQDVTSALPVPGQRLVLPQQLGISVGIDADSNPMTGTFLGCIPGATPLEYVSAAGTRLADGNFEIVGPGDTIGPSAPASEAITTVASHVLSQSFYLSAIGISAGQAVPKFLLSVAAINGSGVLPNVTDCVPKGGVELPVS